MTTDQRGCSPISCNSEISALHEPLPGSPSRETPLTCIWLDGKRPTPSQAPCSRHYPNFNIPHTCMFGVVMGMRVSTMRVVLMYHRGRRRFIRSGSKGKCKRLSPQSVVVIKLRMVKMISLKPYIRMDFANLIGFLYVW